MKLLTRKGVLIEEQGMSYLADSDPDLALGPLRAAACTYRIAPGPRAGQKVLSLQTVPTREPPPGPVRCVDEQDFSLHAEVCCAAHQRKKLGSQGQDGPCWARRGRNMCRYITRPAIANERLALNRAGVELVDQTLHPRRGLRGPSLSSALGGLRKEQLLEDVTVGVCDHCGTRYYSAELLQAVQDLATGKRMPERTEAVPVAHLTTA